MNNQKTITIKCKHSSDNIHIITDSNNQKIIQLSVVYVEEMKDYLRDTGSLNLKICAENHKLGVWLWARDTTGNNYGIAIEEIYLDYSRKWLVRSNDNTWKNCTKKFKEILLDSLMHPQLAKFSSLLVGQMTNPRIRPRVGHLHMGFLFGFDIFVKIRIMVVEWPPGDG